MTGLPTPAREGRLRIGTYARISRASETEILKNQRRSLEAYCRGYKFSVVRRYEEVVSGGKEDRNAFNELLQDARTRKVDLVVFTSLSRMTRGGIEAALYVLRELERAGVGWHFVEQPILNYDSNTPKLAKDIILAVLAAIDEDYRRRISESTKAALARRRALGVRLGRHPNSCRCRKHRKKTVPPATTGGNHG